MKNLVSLGMMALLIAMSCKEKPQNKEIAAVNAEFPAEMEVQVAQDDCGITSTLINGDTYYFWSQSWLDAEKYLNPTYVSPYSPPTSPRITFSGQQIYDLKEQFPNLSAIRLYYGMKDSTSRIPFLIMRAIVDCNTQTTAPPREAVGLIAYDQVNLEFSGRSEACTLWGTNNGSCSFVNGYNSNITTYQNNWIAYQASIGANGFPHVPIKGYSYPWSTIDAIINKDEGSYRDLVVALGMRTIGPNEVSNFYPADSTSGKAGLPVLVNMFLDPIDDLERDVQQQYQDFDFGKPCPTFCN